MGNLQFYLLHAVITIKTKQKHPSPQSRITLQFCPNFVLMGSDNFKLDAYIQMCLIGQIPREQASGAAQSGTVHPSMGQ